MYFYFGIKFENDSWQIGTAILPSRKSISDCIRIEKEMYPQSIWIIGSCRKNDLESTDYLNKKTADTRN